jgi:uncharacterized membrane protein YhaH (DUF805 family)
MTFFDAIKTVFRKYAEFGGRASRPEFWWWTLFSTLVSMALNAVSLPVYGLMYSRMLESGPAFTGGYTSFSFAGLWGIAVLVPSLAVTVRRLRDAGRSWTQLFWVLLPIAGVIVLIVRLCEPSVAVAGRDGVVAGAAAAAAAAAPVPKA